jgi:hypothetical protein
MIPMMAVRNDQTPVVRVAVVDLDGWNATVVDSKGVIDHVRASFLRVIGSLPEDWLVTDLVRPRPVDEPGVIGTVKS